MNFEQCNAVCSPASNFLQMKEHLQCHREQGNDLKATSSHGQEYLANENPLCIYSQKLHDNILQHEHAIIK